MTRVGQAVVVEVDYLSEGWHAARRGGVAASEIAAILGISPWVSPFDLWWLKQTGDVSQAENRAMRRGRRYEALIVEDFADEHPELHVGPSLTLRNIDRPWQVSTPDALAYDTPIDHDAVEADPVAVIEAKTGQRNEWGEPGTDQIPAHYRAQVLWQLDTVGATTAFLPVRFGDQYAEYQVDYDETDVALMRTAAQAFLASIAADQAPDIDAHTATLRRLKRLHRDLVDDEAVIPLHLWRQYSAARRLKKKAEERMRLAENRVRNLAGPAARIRVADDGPTFSHTVTDMKARTQQVAAHQRNTLNWPRKDHLT